MKPGAQRLVGILVSLVLFVAALVVYSSLVLPEYRVIQDLRGQRAAQKALLQSETDSVAAVERLLKEHSSISELRQSIDLTLPEEEEVAEVVNQIQGIASSNSLLLNALSIKPLSVMTDGSGAGSVRPMGSMRILVEAVGDYTALKAFLDALETNIRIMDIYSLQVAKGGTAGPYDYQMEIDTYYQL
jgi:Tfp pilus assembly protein PilO